ncbi:hypothetical protein D3C72_1526410 [compost metagenome]
MARGQLVQQKTRKRHRVAQTGAKGFGAQFAHIRIGVVLRRQKQKPYRDIVPQHRQASLQRSPGGSAARSVPVKTENHLIACAKQLFHMVWRGRRTQRRDGIGNALLRQPHHIHVAFNHDHLTFLANGLARFPKAV